MVSSRGFGLQGGRAFPARAAKQVCIVLAALALLSVLPYARSLHLPFISDDYIQLELGQQYGAPSGWRDLARDPLYRCRATSLLLTHATWRTFGLDPLPFFATSLVLHILNTWLVFALGAWRAVGWRAAAVAAGFFAVYEGHQEAVIWYAALPELLVFFFSLAAFLLWVLWVQSGCTRWRYYAGALVAFLLALGSKESSVVVVALMGLAALPEGDVRRRALSGVVPFAALAAVYALLIHASRSGHLFYHDGTFSLSAPFVLTLLISMARLFWFWGALAGAVLLAARPPEGLRLTARALAWIGITLLPYSFLTYMPRVPSRHTYFASAGLALVCGAAVLALKERWGSVRPWLVPALIAVVVVHNCGYVLTRKHSQFVLRAAPTETLLQVAGSTRGPLYLHCFPYSPDIARAALHVTGVKPPDLLLTGQAQPAGARLLCFGEHGRTRGAPPQAPSVASMPGPAGARY